MLSLRFRKMGVLCLIVIEVRGHGKLVLWRHGVVQGHLQSLALGSAVLEPELNVLGLEPRKLLAVRHAVQFVRVLGDQAVRRVRVVLEPLLEPWNFAYRVDKRPVSLPAFLGQSRHVYARPVTWRWHLFNKQINGRLLYRPHSIQEYKYTKSLPGKNSFNEVLVFENF